MRRLHGLVAVSMVALFGFGVAGTAAAAPPKCGATITQNTTLTANIGPCNQGGLKIGADDITLDLGGFAVFGKPRAGDGVGIDTNGHTGVTVRNGTVRAFDTGVRVAGGGGNTVSGVTARDNIGTSSSRNAKAGLGDGIAILRSNDNSIVGNTVLHNGPFGGITVLADGGGTSAGNVIEDNIVVGNDVAVGGVNQDVGIRIEGPNAPGNLIRDNVVRDSGLDGISVFADQGTGLRNQDTTITGNLVQGNGFHDAGHRKGDGIVVFGSPTNPAIGGADDTVVSDNQVLGNAANGIRVASTSNEITSNTAQGNAAWPGLSNVFDLHDANTSPPCDSNVWTSNVFGTANQACIL